MNISNWSIRSRLGFGFGTLALIVLAVSMLSVWTVSVEHKAFTRFVTETEPRQQMVASILNAANARAIAARNLVLVSDAAARDREQAAVTRAHEAVGRSLSQLKDALAKHSGVSDEEKQLFSAIESVEAKYSVVAERIVGLAIKGQRDEAIKQMDTDCLPLLAALIGATEKYAEHGNRTAAAEIAAADQQFQTNRALLAGGFVVATLLALGLGVTLTRSITRPIEQAVNVARTVAAGDLTSRIEPGGRDETGQLLSALKAMNDSLAGIVANVRQSSDSIATGSAQIASGNADLSQRTERQAANLQQTAASMEQMTASVRHSSDTAHQASQLAGAASAAAERGGIVVSEVVSTMAAITDSSRRIADITGVIDGIAFQTNILALNAAVEAARAGEQGRGFAVVAGEVRALAQRCASAAREINLGTAVGAPPRMDFSTATCSYVERAHSPDG